MGRSFRILFERVYKRLLYLLVMIVLFGGMFAHISMLARLSEQSKRASALEREIARLSVDADNLELSINQYHNLEYISLRARELGMEKSSEGQIRAIDVDFGHRTSDAAAQSGRVGT